MTRSADVLENGPALPAVLQKWWPDLGETELRELDGRAGCRDVLVQLTSLGVRPGQQGLPAAEAAADP